MIVFANYHTHTQRCNHATGEDREYVEQAIKYGFKILGFSDHCPWVFPYGYVSGMRMSPQMVDDYFKSLTDLKEEYQNDIKIYIGFESEYIPELIEAQDKFLADYPVDYMILGQHFMESEIHRGYTGIPSESEERLVKYVDSVIEGMESGRYKYIAHPDLLYFTGEDDIYEKHFTRLCQYLKSKNIPVEINGLGVHDRRHYPSERFLKIAEKTGNTAIIGIDAHYPYALSDGENISECEKIAKRFNLEIVQSLDM